MANQNKPMIVDPMEDMIWFLESVGYNVEEFLSNDILTVDYPTGSEEEFLRHYVLGAGGPFTDFVVGVDLGVGWEYIPNFEDEEEGKKAKKDMEEFDEKIDLLSTMLNFGAYFEVIGRGSIVITKNALGNDFIYDEHSGITGIDCINPMSLDTNSIKLALDDPTGTIPFIQNYSTASGKSGTVELSQDRVIYATRNKFARHSATGVSMYQNALRELRTVVKFPRYRESIARKLANVFRHYTIDQEQIKNTPLGRTVLADTQSEENYLLNIQNLIMQQEQRHSSIATFKWIESSEKTYGGNEPNLDVIEKQTINMLALKMGVPVNIMAYAEDVNRATLETIAEFFVQRRKHGSQKRYKTIIEYIANMCMEMWGYNGTMSIKFNHFVQENETAKFDRIGLLNQRVPNLLSAKEQREGIGKPEIIDYGDADDQIKEKQLEEMALAEEHQSNLNQAQVDAQKQTAEHQAKLQRDNAKHMASLQEVVEPKAEEEPLEKEEQLTEIKDFLKKKGWMRDVET